MAIRKSSLRPKALYLRGVVVPGGKITDLPEPTFHTFLITRGEPFTCQKKVGPARRVALLAGPAWSKRNNREFKLPVYANGKRQIQVANFLK